MFESSSLGRRRIPWTQVRYSTVIPSRGRFARATSTAATSVPASSNHPISQGSIPGNVAHLSTTAQSHLYRFELHARCLSETDPSGAKTSRRRGVKASRIEDWDARDPSSIPWHNLPSNWKRKQLRVEWWKEEGEEEEEEGEVAIVTNSNKS